MTSVTHINPWRLAAGGLLALAAALGIGRFVYTPILPYMVDGIGLTKAQAGFLASANFAGYLAGALGAATPWMGGSRRAWLMTGLLASAATTFLSGATENLFLLGAIRFCGGAASALVMVYAAALIIGRLSAQGDSRFGTVHFAGVGIGIALSAVVVSVLAAHGFGWQAQWFASAGLASLAIPFIILLVPPDGAAVLQGRHGRGLIVDRSLAALVTAYGLFGFGYVITSTFLVTIVRALPEVRVLEPVIWVLFGLAVVPSVAFWTLLGRKIGLFQAFALACLVEAIGVGASVAMPTVFGLVLCAVFLGGTFMGLTALGLFGGQALSAAEPKRVMALLTGSFGAGQIIGPALSGILVERTGDFWLATLLAVAALAVAGLLTFRLKISLC